ncbi:unnamed protein product [Trichogramma brassicae]|uniref:Uncharacterized protein n=1 Tax=Trichogramma brassicae TaxID=86971 RepID=A0A6H5INP3_9HYME|nr:unnamed protein product [Trichogramma brassicae]
MPRVQDLSSPLIPGAKLLGKIAYLFAARLTQFIFIKKARVEVKIPPARSFKSFAIIAPDISDRHARPGRRQLAADRAQRRRRLLHDGPEHADARGRLAARQSVQGAESQPGPGARRQGPLLPRPGRRAVSLRAGLSARSGPGAARRLQGARATASGGQLLRTGESRAGAAGARVRLESGWYTY